MIDPIKDQIKAQILAPSPENIAQVAKALLQDEVVGMPTETVYGLAGNARSPTALARIFSTKERPTFDPLIIHVSTQVQSLEHLAQLNLIDLQKISTSQRGILETLIREFWPGPLTLILPKAQGVPDLATSGLPTVGVRMPAHPVAQALIDAAGCPLAAPSANRFGRISPTTAQAVMSELGDRIHWILDGGSCAVGVESTIIGLKPDSDEIQILRPGGLAPEQLERALGKSIDLNSTTNSHGLSSLIQAPGMLESHYAPSQPLVLLPKVVQELNSYDLEELKKQLLIIPPDAPIGALYLGGDPQLLSQKLGELLKRVILGRSLSFKGDLSEAAQNLFQEMRNLEALQTPIILAEPCFHQTGLGFAIADRLKRASAPKALHKS